MAWSVGISQSGVDAFKKDNCISLNSSQSTTYVYKSIFNFSRILCIFCTASSEFHPLSKWTAKGLKLSFFDI